MVKPLRTEMQNPPSVAFKDFGVLNDGAQSKAAFTTSIITNIVVALLVVIIGSVVKTKINTTLKKENLTFSELPKEPPPPPPPPPKLPPPPKIKLPEPPKIKLPEPEKLPEIKLPEVKMAPTPVKLAPAPPKAVVPPPAPVKVNLAAAQAASIPNHDVHPTAIRLGAADNPLKSLNGPAVAKVNFGSAGAPGMPASNTGNGPNAVKVSMGSGSPQGTNLNGRDNAVRPVSGFSNGIANGTGKPGGTAAVAVNIGRQPEPVHMAPPPTVASAAKPPKVTYKPTPAYTEEAKALHLEGNVSVRIRVTSGGAVQVIAVTRGLGHGLDQSAIQAIQGTRFTPATDATGRPVDWEGVVNVNFQIAS